MGQSGAKIGLSAELFDTHGRPMFGTAPLSLFSEAGLAWDIVATAQGQLPPLAFANYEALLIGGSRVSDVALAGESGRLRVVARNGVGYDAIDTAALSKRGILLTNTPIPVRNAVATSAVAFILALSLRLPLKSRLAREDRWSERADHPGIGLLGRTLGIVGLGGIGRELVRLMQPYGMRILAADPHVDAAASTQAGAVLCELDDLLETVGLRRRGVPPERCDPAAPERGSPAPDETFCASHQCGARLDHRRTGFDLSAERRTNRGRGPRRFRARAARTLKPSPDDGKRDLHRALPVLDGFFLDAVARDAISGIIDAINGRLPRFVVNPEAKNHARVRSWTLVT